MRVLDRSCARKERLGVVVMRHTGPRKKIISMWPRLPLTRSPPSKNDPSRCATKLSRRPARRPTPASLSLGGPPLFGVRPVAPALPVCHRAAGLCRNQMSSVRNGEAAQLFAFTVFATPLAVIRSRRLRSRGPRPFRLPPHACVLRRATTCSLVTERDVTGHDALRRPQGTPCLASLR